MHDECEQWIIEVAIFSSGGKHLSEQEGPDDLKGFVQRDGNLKREMATEGITEAQAMIFLNLVQVEIMQKAIVP